MDCAVRRSVGSAVFQLDDLSAESRLRLGNRKNQKQSVKQSGKASDNALCSDLTAGGNDM